MDATGGALAYPRLRLLGRGGTAEVYAVQLPKRSRIAALKLPIAGSVESVQQFSKLAEREYALIGQERFPGLVRILETPAKPANNILLELCQGNTLDQIGRIESVALLLNIISSLALDLAFLKARRIIHGDLKPHNFFLSTDWKNFDGGSFFYTKLSDFSLGRFEQEPESSRAGLGTVGYMAPETILEGSTSHQSDLFALGVIAYQLATGKHPFMNDDPEPVRVNARVAEHQPQPIDEIRSELPHELSIMIQSLLAKKPSDRPHTAYDVCLTLENIGAQYPFRRVLSPAHLIGKADSYKQTAIAVASAPLVEHARLERISGRDAKALRLVLTANWRQSRIQFDGERFALARNLIWPSRLRKQVLSQFSSLSFGDMRQQIILAVLSCTEPEFVDGAEQSEAKPTALSDLLIHLIRPSTVKRIARRHASTVEREGNYASASRLYVLAGDLLNAVRTACDASVRLVSEHKTDYALRILRRVRMFAELTGRQFDARLALMQEGDALKQIGDSDKALSAYQLIVELYSDQHPDKLLAETFKDLGDLYKMRQNFREGIQSLERALAIYRQLGDVVEISHTLNNLGNIHWINSDLDAALKHYLAALRIQRSGNLKPEIASTLSNIGAIYSLRNRSARSLRLLELSLSLNKELGLTREIARILNNMGYAHAVGGNPVQAVQCLEESSMINRQISSHKELLHNIENLSDILLHLGRVQQSMAYLNEGLTLAEELQDKPHRAILYLTLANAHIRKGDSAAAEQSLTSARAFLDQLEYRQAEPLYLRQCALNRLFVGDYESALTHALESAQSAAQIDDRLTQSQALSIAVRLTDDPAIAESAAAAVNSLGLNRERLLLTFALIEQHLNQDRNEQALELLESSNDSLNALEEDIEIPRLNLIAALTHSRLGRFDSASHFLAKAHSKARSMGLVPELFEILALRAQHENHDREYEQCFATSRQALQIIRQMSEKITSEHDRAIFLNRPVVQNIVVEVRRLGSILGQKQRAE